MPQSGQEIRGLEHLHIAGVMFDPQLERAHLLEGLLEVADLEHRISGRSPQEHH
jgi:hypothetical protein